jgi:hypothetical protein
MYEDLILEDSSSEVANQPIIKSIFEFMGHVKSRKNRGGAKYQLLQTGPNLH